LSGTRVSVTFMLCFVLGKYGVLGRNRCDVEQNFVEMGGIELPDDDPVQCGTGREFCVICKKNWLRNSGKMKWYPDDIWTVRIGQSKPG